MCFSLLLNLFSLIVCTQTKYCEFIDVVNRVLITAMSFDICAIHNIVKIGYSFLFLFSFLKRKEKKTIDNQCKGPSYSVGAT